MTCKIITWDELPERWIRQLKPQKRKRGNPGKRHARPYLDVVTAFDIETSRIPDREESAMYVWQWQFGLEYTVMGRTWDELRFLIRKLQDNMKEGTTLVVLVHNLSYEFQFLRVIYDFSASEVFAIDRRKILKATMYEKTFELRCSYLHSNMSLAAYLKKMGVEHQKISGQEFNYDLIRFPWTELSDLEKSYCQNDVLGLVEAYTEQMRRDGDNLSSIPMTSTGYVRRDAKRAMKLASRQFIHAIQPDLKRYQLLRSLFRGGNTHANRFYVGRITPNVHSADRSSSYPDVICNRKFPVTQFRWIKNPDIRNIRYHIKKGHAVAFRVALWDVELRDRYEGFPYLPRDKCRPIMEGVYDNGRVLKAAYLETAITDIDWQIICRQYKWKHIRGIEAMWSQYGDLPRPLVLTCIEYYQAKTALKGVTSEDGSSEYQYARSKELLNSLYGMMAQDPLKYNVLFDPKAEGSFYIEEGDPEVLLKKYTAKAFLVYQWGCWTTAWARHALDVGLQLAGRNAIYCDTDSVKYMGDVDWSAFNEQCVKDCKRTGAHATDANGTEHYMGVFEPEQTTTFVTLGAKKYAYMDDKGHITITVAGVNKKLGGEYLAEHGGLEAFRNGFIFPYPSGGLESVYNDIPGSRWIYVDGHPWEIGPNIYLKPSTYTLGQTAEYLELLSDPLLFERIRHKHLSTGSAMP